MAPGDVCMVVCDGLKGLPAAIETVWPQAITQTCIVHLLRNSFRYASKKDWAAIAKDLKPIYTAPSESAALDAFVAFTETWGDRYPAIIKLWENAWAGVRPVPAVRHGHSRCGLHDQHAIEIHQLRGSAGRSTPAATFPTEQAALKCVYLAIMSLDPTGRGRRRWSNRWKDALNAFEITFDGRLSAGRK